MVVASILTKPYTEDQLLQALHAGLEEMKKAETRHEKEPGTGRRRRPNAPQRRRATEQATLRSAICNQNGNRGGHRTAVTCRVSDRE